MSDIYVGIREETEDRKDESVLRQHVCPSCGNVDILTGDEELDKDVKPSRDGAKLNSRFYPPKFSDVIMKEVRTMKERFIVRIDNATIGKFDTAIEANNFAKAISEIYVATITVTWIVDTEYSWF